MKVIFLEQARKEFLKLDKPIKLQISKYILKLQEIENPRTMGKPLVGTLSGFWRYRVGDYRLICKIKDEQLIINVIEVGHRSKIYDR